MPREKIAIASRKRPRYAVRRPSQMIASALPGALSYAALASASRASSAARASGERAAGTSGVPNNDTASASAGTGDGAIDVFSSDHAPYRYDDPQGKKAHGDSAPFTKVPNGVPSLELRMPLLFSEGVTTGRIGLERFVDLTATRPAQLYGLFPRKGCIRVGADADLAVWDPEREVTVTQAALHDRMDYTPFEGMIVRGWPVVTVSRGEVVWKDGEVRGEPGRGRFVRRERAT